MYQQIVAEIRERIRGGELRPGDRVPSTRQIVRQWGVAMATATKVIAALRDEGLVDTKPGAGTVVRAVGRPAGASPRVGREPIVAAAMRIADAEGLTPLSLRRVATELGVPTMSLYRHVPSKEELLMMMADEAFATTEFPPRPAHWRARLETAGRLMWTVFKRHPWAAELLSITRPQVLPHLLDYAEWSIGTLRGLGLPNDDVMYTHILLFGHVRGTALGLQAEERERQDTGQTAEEWMAEVDTDLDALVPRDRYPALRDVFATDFDYALDAVFEQGMQTILDGIEARFVATCAPASPQGPRPR